MKTIIRETGRKDREVQMTMQELREMEDRGWTITLVGNAFAIAEPAEDPEYYYY